MFMLITLSGPDGSGKTTQAKKLLNAFNKVGLNAISITDIIKNFNYESGYDSYLNNLYNRLKKYDVIHTRFRLHSRENAMVMDELEVSPLGNFKLATLSAYTAYYDYIQFNKYVNEPLLKEGKIIICDKYAFDDIAFKSTYGCQYEWMKKIYYDITLPNIGFYFDVNPNTIMERNLYRPDGRIVFYESFRNTCRLQYYYERIIEDYNVIKINGNHLEDEVYNELLNKLKAKCDKLSL